MPTTFAHDVFGRDVFRALPRELKDVVRRGKGVYRIGVHGPDIFFYYHPLIRSEVRAHGEAMHSACAADFFARGVEEYRREPSARLASYLLGFATHFCLDSTCHGYINQFEKETGVSHAEIETELDRRLLLREHKKLFHYLPASATTISQENIRVICRMFPDVTPGQIRIALEGQKFFDRLLNCPTPLKQKIVLNGMRVLGCYDQLEGQVMRPTVNPRTLESTECLMALYGAALECAPPLLENLYRCMTGREKTLAKRFDRDYNGKKTERRSAGPSGAV